MTEYEMMDLITSMESLRYTQFSILLTMISGFLVASYVFGHRLTVPALLIFVALFTFFFVTTTLNMARNTGVTFALMWKIQSLAQSGQGFDWHPLRVVTIPEYLSRGGLAFYSVVIANALMYLATIAFLFIVRRANLAAIKAEAAAKATPPAPETPKPPSDSAML